MDQKNRSAKTSLFWVLSGLAWIMAVFAVGWAEVSKERAKISKFEDYPLFI